MVRTLDFCRDEDVFPEVDSQGEGPVQRPWRCHTCQNEFDRVALEERLISRIQAVFLEWQIQDLRCKKCGSLQGDIGLLREHCACGGEWEGVSPKQDMKETVEIMGRVANAYEMKMLRGVVDRVQDVR